jgi:hypothetical protein
VTNILFKYNVIGEQIFRRPTLMELLLFYNSGIRSKDLSARPSGQTIAAITYCTQAGRGPATSTRTKTVFAHKPFDGATAQSGPSGFRSLSKRS